MDYRLEQLRFELREDPTSRIFFKLGEHLRREGELDEAIDVLQHGLERHPRYVAAWVSLGRALHDFGDAAGAVKAFLKALKLDPENGVAARSAGEAAIANGDWIEAVKNLKRARGIMPQDDALDERIAFVEERLDELGMLEVKPVAEPVPPVAVAPPAVEPETDEVFVVEDGVDVPEPAVADDVFETNWEAMDPDEDRDEALVDEPEPVEATLDEDGVETGGLSQPREEVDFEIVNDSADERSPFDTSSIAIKEPVVEGLGDAEVELLEAEAEIHPPVVEEPEPFEETPAEAVTAAEPDPEPVFDLVAEDVVDETEEIQFESGETVQTPDDVPLPTVTLARLAMEQGDFALAERTARAVLEREPDQPDAIALLETFAARNETGIPDSGACEGVDERAQALQRWLEAVRLAAEKLES